MLVLSTSLQSAASFFPSTPQSSIPRTTTRSFPSILFQTTWGGSDNDWASGVAHDSSRNIYVTGYTYSFCCGSPDVFIVKFNSTGSLLWQRAWPANISSRIYSASGNALAVDAVGNAYVTGYVITNASSAGKDVLLLKFNASGDLLWQRSWGGVGDEEGWGIALDPWGGVYVTGSTYSPFPGLEKAFVLKFESYGGLLWQEVWGWSAGFNYGSGIAADFYGNVFVSAFFMDSYGYPTNPVLLKLNSTGALQWQETWGGNSYISGFEAMAVSVDPSGNAYVTGSVDGYISGSRIDGIPVMKFDRNGTIIWQEVLPGPASSDGLVLDSSSSVFLTGSSGLLLLELSSSSGGLEWEAGGGNLGLGRSIAVDSAGNPIVVGSVNAGPPYTLTELDYTIVTANYSAETALGVVYTASFTASTLNLSALTPPGSQNYSGQNDAFILKVKPPQQSPPSPPLALIAEAGGNNISLSWAPSEFNGRSPVTGYHVYRGGSSSGEAPLANTSSVLSYIDTNVEKGATYYYYVKAVNALGESDASNEARAAAGVTPGLTRFVPSDSTLLVGTAISLAAVAAFVFYRRRIGPITSAHG